MLEPPLVNRDQAKYTFPQVGFAGLVWSALIAVLSLNLPLRFGAD